MEESWLALHFARNIVSTSPHLLGGPVKEGHRDRESYEYMTIKILEVREAYRLLRAGKIIHSPTLSALGLAEKAIIG